MRKAVNLLLTILFLASASNAQNADSLRLIKEKHELIPCIDASIGFIPDKDYKKFTVSLVGNNLYLKRCGAFAMVELNFDSPAVLIGPTVSFNHWMYAWAGIDFITARGIFTNDESRGKGIKNARKDLGVGFYPWEWAVVKVAYSFNAGPRAEIGLRFPLHKEKKAPQEALPVQP